MRCASMADTHIARWTPCEDHLDSRMNNALESRVINMYFRFKGFKIASEVRAYSTPHMVDARLGNEMCESKWIMWAHRVDGFHFKRVPSSIGSIFLHVSINKRHGGMRCGNGGAWGHSQTANFLRLNEWIGNGAPETAHRTQSRTRDRTEIFALQNEPINILMVQHTSLSLSIRCSLHFVRIGSFMPTQ